MDSGFHRGRIFPEAVRTKTREYPNGALKSFGKRFEVGYESIIWQVLFFLKDCTKKGYLSIRIPI